VLTVLVVLEAAALIALGLRMTRPKLPAARRARFPLLLIAGAIIVQCALMLVVVNAVGSAFPGGVPVADSRRLLAAGLTIWGTQAVRLSLLVLALSAWMRIVVADPANRKFSLRHPRTLLALSLSIEALQSAGAGVPRAATFVPLILLLIRQPTAWTATYRGARRVLLFLGALVVFCFSQEMIVTSAQMGEQGTLVTMFRAPQLPLVDAAMAEPFTAAVRAAAPLTIATRVILNVLALHALALMFRVGLPRLDLPAFGFRTVSLKRRFAMTYVLIRLVPSLISFAIIVAGLYFLIGVGKVSRATETIEGVMTRCAAAAGRILEETTALPAALPAAPPAARDADAVARILSAARGTMAQDSAQTHLVFRAIETEAVRAGSAATGGGAEDSATSGSSSVRSTVTATPATPADLIALPYAADWTRSAARGLVLAGGRLYVHASAARRFDSTRSEIAEVYVAIDSSFVSRVALEAGADVSIATRPGTLVRRGPEGLTLGPAGTSGAAARRLAAASDPALASGRGPIDIEPVDSTWARSRIEVSAPEPGDAAKKRDESASRYLAKDVLPIGDWAAAEIVPHGAVAITLHSTLPRVLRGLYAIAIPLLVKIGTPVILLAAGLLLFAEALAVRAGRGIARAILADVGEITGAARRIGEGDLMHRVPIRGRDELSKLGATLNEMAANLDSHQKELLEKERLEADLAVAREIQQRLLPQGPPTVAGLDVAGVSIPSREVGGDLFAFLPLDGGRLGIALGDVSGKSVPAALLMSNALAALKAQVQHAASVDQSLANVNRLICEDVEPGRFVTLFFGVIDPAAGEIRHASAGHNPPLVMSAAGGERWLSEGGLPLGVSPEAEYQSAVARLAPGDVLVIYSDGVTEAEGPADASAPDEPAMFGEERVAATVRALGGQSAAEIVEGIVAAVRTFAAGIPQGDDLTLVVIKLLAR